MDNYEAVNITAASGGGFNGSNVYDFDFQNGLTSGWSPSSGSTWSVASHNNSQAYYLSSTPANGGNGALGQYSTITGSNYGDFTLLCNAAAVSGSTSNFALVFGYQNATNYYYMNFSAASGATALYRVVSGTGRNRLRQFDMGQLGKLPDTNNHLVQITRNGTSLSVWFAGQERVLQQFVDSAFGIAGQIGVGGRTARPTSTTCSRGSTTVAPRRPSSLSAAAAGTEPGQSHDQLDQHRSHAKRLHGPAVRGRRQTGSRSGWRKPPTAPASPTPRASSTAHLHYRVYAFNVAGNSGSLAATASAVTPLVGAYESRAARTPPPARSIWPGPTTPPGPRRTHVLAFRTRRLDELRSQVVVGSGGGQRHRLQRYGPDRTAPNTGTRSCAYNGVGGRRL